MELSFPACKNGEDLVLMGQWTIPIFSISINSCHAIPNLSVVKLCAFTFVWVGGCHGDALLFSMFYGNIE